MLVHVHSAAAFVLAAVQGGTTSGKDESSNFLVSPDVGLMIWTLLSFVVALLVLRKFAFPAISEALDKRQRAIEESIDAANKSKAESEALLDEYRERLKEARAQADEIVAKARKSGDDVERSAAEAGKLKREEMLAQARKDIQGETRRAIQEIRSEVADLTVAATEKVTRKTLTAEDQKRLVEDALGALDFSTLGERKN
jgi:F-type H+-transporting ATPase subunit b